jgi:hypothetical protein
MASHALALYTPHSSSYNKERALSFAHEYLGREEARSISMAPLATLPPPRSNGYSSKGDNLKKKLEGGTIGIKQAAQDSGGPNKRPFATPSSSTRSHLSSSFLTAKLSFPYTVIGIDKSKRERGKVLMVKKVPKT